MFALTLAPPVFASGNTAEEGGSAAVQSDVQSGVITGFAELARSEYCFEGQPLEEELVAALPQSLEVYLDGAEESCQIPVTWETVEDFDNTSYYFYSVRPVWDEEFCLAEGIDDQIDVPWITVFREPTIEEEEQGEVFIGRAHSDHRPRPLHTDPVFRTDYAGPSGDPVLENVL